MANRLLDRQRSLLAHLTSGAAIFGDLDTRIPPSIAGIDPRLLHFEAWFSHKKRMEKIAGVFWRSLELLGNEQLSIERAFAEACPPVAIARLGNARQFYNFLSSRWPQHPPKPCYLPDVAACELACAEARERNDPRHANGDKPASNCEAKPEVLRRSSGVLLLRCAHDIGALFEKGSASMPPPAKRDVALAIAIAPGAADPSVIELDDNVFNLLAALDDWTERRFFGKTPEAESLLADLAVHGLLELRA
jgi:hypothetical protein